MWATSGADDQREAPGPGLDPPARVEADQRHRDRAQEEAQAAADRLVEVAVEHEARPVRPTLGVDQEAAMVGRVADDVVAAVRVLRRRDVAEPERLRGGE